jgi:hypothetical protein
VTNVLWSFRGWLLAATVGGSAVVTRESKKCALFGGCRGRRRLISIVCGALPSRCGNNGGGPPCAADVGGFRGARATCAASNASVRAAQGVSVERWMCAATACCPCKCVAFPCKLNQGSESVRCQQKKLLPCAVLGEVHADLCAGATPLLSWILFGGLLQRLPGKRVAGERSGIGVAVAG